MPNRILKFDFLEKDFKTAAIAAIESLAIMVDLKIVSPEFILNRFKYLVYYLEHTKISEYEHRTKLRPMYPNQGFFEKITLEILDEKYERHADEGGHILIYNCESKEGYVI